MPHFGLNSGNWSRKMETLRVASKTHPAKWKRFMLPQKLIPQNGNTSCCLKSSSCKMETLHVASKTHPAKWKRFMFTMNLLNISLPVMGEYLLERARGLLLFLLVVQCSKVVGFVRALNRTKTLRKALLSLCIKNNYRRQARVGTEMVRGNVSFFSNRHNISTISVCVLREWISTQGFLWRRNRRNRTKRIVHSFFNKGAKIQTQQRTIQRRWFDTAGHFQDFQWNVFVEVTSALHMHSSERRKDSSPYVIMKFVIWHQSR